jgi:hypothetical protein
MPIAAALSIRTRLNVGIDRDTAATDLLKSKPSRRVAQDASSETTHPPTTRIVKVCTAIAQSNSVLSADDEQNHI